ncbi:hypothetical protein [Azospirillum lipoferum]|uniref:hypothetical protein n=1 Tax=Azospirillum lipoferum TaxID=193 RepID=UPI001395F247|nr:hypothetical protein [Azospirillum lipoferum]
MSASLRIVIVGAMSMGLAMAFTSFTAWSQVKNLALGETFRDARIFTNPVLRELEQKDPELLREVLRQIDEAVALPPSGTVALGHQTPTPAETQLLKANPDIAKALSLRPDPMLILLQQILKSTGKGN